MRSNSYLVASFSQVPVNLGSTGADIGLSLDLWEQPSYPSSSSTTSFGPPTPPYLPLSYTARKRDHWIQTESHPPKIPSFFLQTMSCVVSWNCGLVRLPWPVLLLLLMEACCHAAPSGPESDSCSTLVQNRFFGFFLSSSVFPSMPCSWTLQNPDPRRYTVFIKVTKPTEDCVPSQLRTFQYDSFLETTRTYLGMESFNEVVRLCDTSAPVAFLEAGKQFLQMRKGPPQAGTAFTSDGNGDFKTEYLVVGKRNPSMAACQMLCQWLEDCLSSSTSNRPCGIMQTPCTCWEPPPQLSEGDSCYHNGVYLENCLPSIKETDGKDVEISGE